MVGAVGAYIYDRLYWRGLGPKVGQGDNPFKADMMALRGRFDDAQEKLAKAKLDNEELQSQLAQVSSGDTTALIRDLDQAKTTILELQSNSRSDQELQRQLLETRTELAALQSGASSGNNDLTQRLAEAEAELDGYRSIEEITKVEMAELRRKAAMSSSEVPPLPSPELSTLKDEIMAKDTRIGELQALLASTGGVSHDVEAKESQIRALTSQLESSREMIRRLEDRIFNEKVSESSVDEDTLVKRAEGAEGRVVQLQGEAEALRQELERMKFNLDDRDKQIASATLMADLEHLQQQADASETARRDLEAQLRVALAKIDESANQPAQAAELQMQLSEANEKLKSAMIASDRAAFQDRQIQALEADLHAARAAQTQLQAEMLELRDKDSKKSALKQDIEDLTAKLQEKENKIAALMTEAAGFEAQKTMVDTLQHQNSQLIQQTEALSAQVRLAEAQAEQSEHSAVKTADLEMKLANANRELADVHQLRASLEHHRTALGRVIGEVNSLRDGLAPISSSTAGPPTMESVPFVATAPVPTAEPSLPKRDPLEQINGIGFVYERKLWDAGILTFSDLASATPDEITKAIMPEPWQHIEPTEWILEAADRVAGE